MVAARSAAETGDILVARLRGLLEAGWDARLLCEGEGWAESPAIRDPALASSVALKPERDWYPPPRSVLGRPRMLRRYLGEIGKTRAFDQHLLKLRPDLIHFQSAHSARAGIRLGRTLNRRVAVSFRADGRGLEIPDLEVLWEGADLLLFSDDAVRDRAVSWGCRPERAEVLPLPLRDSRPPQSRRQSNDEPLEVISAGPLTWEQGYEHSIHAVRLLLDMGVRCRYRILGEGEHLDAVGFARHELGLEDAVDLVSPACGYPLEEELRAADVFLDPAVSAAVPTTPLAMARALKIPFIATYRERLPADGGIAVARRDPEAIAAALASLAADPTLRQRLGSEGNPGEADYPTFRDDVRRLDELYRQVLA
jgi:glycosyltransferase involved in cell wall biosynthesis